MKNYKNYTDIKVAKRDYLFYKKMQERFSERQKSLREYIKKYNPTPERLENINMTIFCYRCTLRYLQEYITNINKDIKRLDLESTMVDIARRIKASEETTRKYEEIAKEALVTDKDGNKYYMTEEGRKKIMSKIVEVANVINQKSKKK